MSPGCGARLYPGRQVGHIIDREQRVRRGASQWRDIRERVVWCEENKPAVVAMGQRQVPARFPGDGVLLIGVDGNFQAVAFP